MFSKDFHTKTETDRQHCKNRNMEKERLLGSYRLHEGTVYSLDAIWTYDHVGGGGSNTNRSQKAPSKRAVEPEQSAGTITLISGSHDQTISVSTVSKLKTRKGMSVNVNQECVLRGHTADVYALECLTPPESKEAPPYGTLVSGGDYSVRLWDVKGGTCLNTLNGHTGYVACIKIRGKRAFSGSWDTTIRSWNLEAGKPMHVFKGHTNIVNCVDVTDTDIYSGSWDMTIIRWSRATGMPVHTFQGHTDGVQCLQVVEDHLFSGSMDKTLRMWSLRTGRVVRTFKGHTGGIECLHTADKLCFSGSYDKTIRCFKVETGECIAIFEGHTDGIYSVKYFDGLLFSGSGDKTVRIWDVSALTTAAETSWWWNIFSFFKK